MDPTLRRDIEQLHEASFAWALACCAFRRDEAEDVLQTVYLKVLEGRARHEGRASLRTWLFAVIRNTAADRRRQSWMWTLGLDRLWQKRVPQAPGPDGAERAQVRAALAELPGRQREVIELVFYHQLTVEEAAQVMGVSVGSARVHYDRAKRRLAERLR
jgi:RNA polymerase sigma-70 factor (ECF subfamily)